MGDGRTRTKLQNATLMETETGEIRSVILEVQERSGPVRPKAKEPFTMAYMSGLSELHTLKLSGRERDTLDQLVIAMGYGEPFIRPTVAQIAKTIGTDRGTVNAAVNRFRKLGILFDFDDGTSLLNPRLYWRGSEEARREWIGMLDAGVKPVKE